MKRTGFLKTAVTALCLALLCGSCVVHRDRPPRPPHHKKHKKHKKPKKPRHRHHGAIDTNDANATYYAWQGVDADVELEA